MKISTSILNIMNDKKRIMDIQRYTDYFHIDVMDGIFVKNKTLPFDELYPNIKDISRPMDVHLMVKDIRKYVDLFSKIRPKYITFHYEASDDIRGDIDYIKSKGIKVGLAINPETSPSLIDEFLDDIDLVLIMSVHPGKGGQKYIDIRNKIDYFLKRKKEHHYIIEVDGGINNETIRLIDGVDIAVTGSYITNSLNLRGTFKTLRGFTLIELLGVIAIIGILAGVVTFSVSSSISRSRLKVCTAQEKSIIDASKIYFTDNPLRSSVTIRELIDSGELDKDTLNPANDKAYDNNTSISKDGVINYAGSDTYSGGVYNCDYLKGGK